MEANSSVFRLPKQNRRPRKGNGKAFQLFRDRQARRRVASSQVLQQPVRRSRVPIDPLWAPKSAVGDWRRIKAPFRARRACCESARALLAARSRTCTTSSLGKPTVAPGFSWRQIALTAWLRVFFCQISQIRSLIGFLQKATRRLFTSLRHRFVWTSFGGALLAACAFTFPVENNGW